METFLKDKKISISVFILIVIISLFVFAKLVNEVKASKYVGSDLPNTIFVNGSGEIKAVSDIASLNINLNKEGATAKEAQSLLNESIDKTLTYLKTQNIDDKDIKSEYGGLSPKYSYNNVVCYAYPCPSKDPKIIGYTASQSIVVKIRDVDNASVVRTGLTEIGVTDINGPYFSIDDEELLKDEARALAIAKAKEKAKILADQLGVKLGRVISFSDNSNSRYPTYSLSKSMMSDASAEAGGSAPTLPKGENTITSEVTITYEIK